jgi:replicative DNA helicase
MEENENTFGKYLGPEFQLKLLWQILVDSEFGDKTVPDISVDYFDDFTQKKLFIVIRDYYRENEKVPSLSNDSIRTAIYKNNNQTNNEHDLEELKANVDKIQRWEDRVSNGKTENDGYIVQKDATTFIKQQEYRRLGELILSKTKSGEIAKKTFVGDIEEKVNKIGCIGDVEDNGTLLTEGVERALRKEFRETIPTGIKVIDTVTGGGLGKGEVGIILAPSGVGKSTLLTKIANSGYEMGKNILQIIFEDKDEEIKRKHYSIWSGIPLSEFNNNEEEVNALVNKKIKTIKKGLLKIKRFSEEDTTMINVKNWIIKNQKKNNLKYDEIILDYLDCL